MASTSSSAKFEHEKHVKFWLRSSSLLPNPYQSGDANRMSLGFFIVSALDLLGLLNPANPKAIKSTEKQSWIRWIYSLQCPEGGFRGSDILNLGWRRSVWNKCFDGASLANTFLALLTLIILDDDLQRINKAGIAAWVKGLQRLNGGFGENLLSLPGMDREHDNIPGMADGREDMRMCYCAAGVAYILGPKYSCLDAAKLRKFVSSAQSYEGGLGQGWEMEGHSGLNFCGIACLELLRRCEEQERGLGLASLSLDPEQGHPVFSDLDLQECVKYMLARQTTWVDELDDEDEDEEATTNGVPDASEPATVRTPPPGSDETPIAGFNGRPNKMANTCYCYWNLGALAIFNSPGAPPTHPVGLTHLAHTASTRKYLLDTTQHQIGGFSKAPGEHPDLMHSYLALAALSVIDINGGKEDIGIKEMDAALCTAKEVRNKIDGLPWRGKDG